MRSRIMLGEMNNLKQLEGMEKKKLKTGRECGAGAAVGGALIPGGGAVRTLPG